VDAAAVRVDQLGQGVDVGALELSFASAVVGEATQLGLDIPEEVPGCVATLVSWSRLLRDER